MKNYITLFTLLLIVQTISQAEELHLIVNGKAIHLDDGDYNEENYGLGLEYDFVPRGRWIPFLNASFFKDSNNQTSKYAGGGVRYRYLLGADDEDWHVDIGAIAFLMTRRDYRNNNPFVGALPFASVGKSFFHLNVTYIPEVSPKHKDLFFFQLMFRLHSF